MARVSLRLDDAGRKLVSDAVAAAEAGTAGEIVTIVTEQSDTYADIALAWSAAAAFLAITALSLFPDFYLGLFDWLTGAWHSEWTPDKVLMLAAGVGVAKFIALTALQLWPPLRFLLVPGRIKSMRSRARAVTFFKVGAERRTHGRTGILIYVSMREHRAEIVADEAIAGQVSDEVWGEAMAALLAQIRRGCLAEGMAAAVERVGRVLAEHFPRAENDVNELPDRLIEV
jgi:putative membrane protein